MLAFLRQRTASEKAGKILLGALTAPGAVAPIPVGVALTAAPAAIVITSTPVEAQQPNCARGGVNGVRQPGSSNVEQWRRIGYCNTAGGQGTRMGTYGVVPDLGSNDAVRIGNRYYRGGDLNTGTHRREVSREEAERLARGGRVLSGAEYARRKAEGEAHPGRGNAGERGTTERWKCRALGRNTPGC